MVNFIFKCYNGNIIRNNNAYLVFVWLTSLCCSVVQFLVGFDRYGRDIRREILGFSKNAYPPQYRVEAFVPSGKQLRWCTTKRRGRLVRGDNGAGLPAAAIRRENGVRPVYD